MLYVFYVEYAKRLTFNMSLVNESVERLKLTIEEHCNIATNKQILLISGGGALQDTAKVCNYSAGTDTNPIYLFNRVLLERDEMPSINLDFGLPIKIDNELNHIYDSIMNSTAPATIYTINKINNLAQKYMEQAMETKSYCDQLNNDQLLQQQGLAAAIANLDDVLGNFKNQFKTFDVSYTHYLETRDENMNILSRCAEEDLKLLSQIPLLRALLENNDEERSRLEMCWEQNQLSDLSLLDWIATKDPEQNLETTIADCLKALRNYDGATLASLKEEIDELLHPDRLDQLYNNSTNSDISTKLMTLSGLIATIDQTWEDQKKKASGIKRNHDRAAELKEDCILPDLLETHRSTIKIMRDNHTNLRSCRQLCAQAKMQLCDIIHHRLKDIMKIQERVAEIQANMKLHGDFLKRICTSIKVVNKLNMTPRYYMAAVSEVVRRRSYSQAFLMWASEIACRIYNVYTEELDRRRKFVHEFKGHFLTSLFPGMEDIPPPFATQPPALFDNNLPPLCVDDLKKLCDDVPSLTEGVVLPDVEAIRQFFLTKSLTLSQSEDLEEDGEKNDDDKLAVVGAAVSAHDPSSSFSKSEPSTSSDSNYGTHDSASTNDSSKQIERMSQDQDLLKIRQSMAVLGSLTQTTVISLRDDLSALRNWVFTHQTELAGAVQHLHDQTQLQRSHIETLLQTINAKDETLRTLLAKVARYELEKLERESVAKDVQEGMAREHDKVVREVTENLNHSHRQEMEALRQRFKLMACTNMERCPSETSLEKVEGTNVIDSAKHEQIINQLKMSMDIEHGKILQQERLEHQRQMDELIAKHEAEKLALAKSIRDAAIEEQEKQMERMKMRENSLLVDLQRHKNTIHTLAAPEGMSNTLVSRIEQLETEKRILETELVKERKTKYTFNPNLPSTSMVSMNSETSVSLSSLRSDPESPRSKKNRPAEATKRKMDRSHQSTPPNSKICMTKCDVGDTVLVVWDEKLKNYMILQDSSVLCFVHPDSLGSLGLTSVSDGSPKKFYCPVQVVHKEYCKTKKIANRYNMEPEEKFFRVYVKPWNPSD